MTKKKLEKYIEEIRPKADCYDRICKVLGRKNNILGYIKKLNQEIKEVKMNCTTAEEFIKLYKDNISNISDLIIDDIEHALRHNPLVIEDKVVIPLPRHPDINKDDINLRKIKEFIINKYLLSGWKDAYFNESNASYSVYNEFYLFLPKNSVIKNKS